MEKGAVGGKDCIVAQSYSDLGRRLGEAGSFHSAISVIEQSTASEEVETPLMLNLYQICPHYLGVLYSDLSLMSWQSLLGVLSLLVNNKRV